MEAFFTNPVTMAAGAALVSAPVIIHLINRMRFRRVRWAAMEFLLKAQKRMRRKLIIEQLILLLLRCLLVFLVGVLLARFKWFTPLEGEEGRATAHVVVLDDSPSTADAFAADGKPSTAFDQAKAQVVEKIAPAAAQANTPQSMDLLLLSDLRQPNDDPATQRSQPTVAKPRAFERLNESAIGDLRTYLNPIQPSAKRVSLVDGLRTAKEVLDKKPDSDVAKVVHVVSDLRAVDWSEDGETLKQLLGELTTAGVKVHLIDIAYPHRKDTEKQPRASDNVSVLELRPKSKVVARRTQIEFEVRVRNSGTTEMKDVRLEFFLNGRKWPEVSARIANLPPHQERTETAVAVGGIDRVGTEKDPLGPFNVVTVRLADPENGGLTADNVRHAVVEVREFVSVLLIEGRPNLRDKPKGDGFYLRKLLTNQELDRIKIVDGSPADLEKLDLGQFVSIHLVNVPTLSDPQRDKLEAYVRGGGGLGLFLGPNVLPQQYNKVLYRGGTGVLPFPLPESGPTPPPTDEQKFKKALVLSKRVLTRDPAVKVHPALAGLYAGDRGSAAKDIEKFFMFANIDQHWPIQRLLTWQENKAVRELYCLPNEKPMSEFQGPARDLLEKLKAKLAEPKFEKYRPVVEPLDRQIRDTSAGDLPLAVLANLYDRLICDQINDGDPSEPILREMWGQPELADLKAAFQKERDRVKFGDPLYAVKHFGDGRVAVMTTDAGATHTATGGGTGEVTWTDWPSGYGAPGWLAVVAEMHRYLSGGAADENRSVGAAYHLALDPAAYQRKNGETRAVKRTFVAPDATKGEKAGDLTFTPKPLGDQPLAATPGGPVFDFTEGRDAGVYVFELTHFTGPDGETEKKQYLAAAFNVDAQREGDLRRANRDDLAQYAPKVPVHSPDDTSWVNALKQKRDDFSTRRWLYLFILLVLVAEQAMAVRLSFHTRPEDLDVHAPSAAAAYAHATTLPAVAPAEPPTEPAGV
jgi:hypothetical protein